MNSTQSIQTFVAIRKAAQTSVAFFDLSDRTQIEVTGTDRARFLHAFTSNDVKALKPGQGCETFLTSLKGKVVAHFFVFCDENSFWLDGTPGQQEAITTHLRKFLLIDDVQLNVCGPERGELFVTGPMAGQLLQLDDALAVGGHLHRETDNRSLHLRRVDLLGVPGYLMSIPAQQIDGVKQGLTAIGVPEGPRELFDILRIEAGSPEFGVDITEENLAQEVARTKQCISFNKGCYLGQETIARLDAIGHTNWELRRLQFDSPSVPVTGTVIFDATGDIELGTVTSAAPDLGTETIEALRSFVALGYIKRVACNPGTSVLLKIEGHNITGRVLGPGTPR